MDDVLLNKVATLERCIQRIREEYTGHEADFETQYTRQDAVILNLQRACEATIDMAMRLVRLKHLGVPQSSRDVFVLLEQAGFIPPDLSRALQGMVGFRNIAVHDYSALNLKVVQYLIENRLEDLLAFTRLVIPVAMQANQD